MNICDVKWNCKINEKDCMLMNFSPISFLAPFFVIVVSSFSFSLLSVLLLDFSCSR